MINHNLKKGDVYENYIFNGQRTPGKNISRLCSVYNNETSKNESLFIPAKHLYGINHLNIDFSTMQPCTLLYYVPISTKTTEKEFYPFVFSKYEDGMVHAARGGNEVIGTKDEFTLAINVKK